MGGGGVWRIAAVGAGATGGGTVSVGIGRRVRVGSTEAAGTGTTAAVVTGVDPVAGVTTFAAFAASFSLLSMARRARS